MSKDLSLMEMPGSPALVDEHLPAPMRKSCPVESYLNELRSVQSRRQQKSRLNAFARIIMQSEDACCFHVPWASVDREALILVMNYMKEQGSAHSSINGVLSAVKGVLKAGYEHNILPYERFRQVSTVKGFHLGDQLTRRRRAIEPNIIRQLLSSLDRDPTPWGLRDRAMLHFMVNTGVRRAEVAGLLMQNMNLNRASAVVVGKGGYQRSVAFPMKTRDHINEWIAELRGDEPGALFCPITPHETLITERCMAPESVNRILNQRVDEAGLPKGAIEPHDLRRTYASMFLENTPDIIRLRDILGHKSVSTTEIYDRRQEEVTLQSMRDFDILDV